MGRRVERSRNQTPAAALGEELRRCREEAQLTQNELGQRLFCSGTFVGFMETGTRRMQPEMADRLDSVLGTGGFFSRLSQAIHQQRHAAYFADTAEQETRAATICEYAPTLVPGLLQTETYARTVIKAYEPLATAEDVAVRVTARTERAAILDNPTTRPMLWMILHENVLDLPVGGPEVMHEQLTHIGDLMADGRLLLQVLPRSRGAHAALDGGVFLLTFADAPPVAYVETLHTGHLIDDPAMVRRYERTYDLLRASAMSPEDSLTRINRATEEHA